MCWLVSEIQGGRFSFLCHLVMKLSLVNANPSKCFCEGSSQTPSPSLPPKRMRMDNYLRMHVDTYCYWPSRFICWYCLEVTRPAIDYMDKEISCWSVCNLSEMFSWHQKFIVICMYHPQRSMVTIFIRTPVHCSHFAVQIWFGYMKGVHGMLLLCFWCEVVPSMVELAETKLSIIPTITYLHYDPNGFPWIHACKAI